MPDFWEFPTVSMGLGPMNAVYQARFNRYLHSRGIKDTSDQHVWAFLGDGEMDEPESLGVIGLAAREELDNLTFVINCNLQRRSEEHTSELQSRQYLVCRLLLEKKKKLLRVV